MNTQQQSRIKRLSLHEAQKIAAGEVVERPVSVVKELIENSLDAGATTIDLHFIDAGRQKIRIIDNGHGMSPEDARICMEQYTTSKISSVDQLPQLTTFGFRGEALASIAAVSKYTLITKYTHAPQGIRISNDAHGQQHETMIAAPTGTDLTVEEIFFNVPARRKFLKTAETEWRQIMILIQAFCLNYPEVHFTVTHNDTLVLACPSTSRIARMAQLWDATTAQQMVSFTRAHREKDVSIQGLISSHQVSKFDRSSVFFFVNKRWVKNQALSKALLKGYMNVLPPGRFPIAALFIDIDPSTVDINVHPRKEEVLFLHAQTVEQLIQAAVREALEEHLTKQLQRPTPEKQLQRSLPTTISLPLSTPFDDNDYAPYAPIMTPPFMAAPTSPINVITSPAAPLLPQELLSENNNQLSCIQTPALETEASFDIIGYYKNTYILIEKDDGLLIVDQHAAHERILYEQFSSRFEMLAPNALIFPITVKVSPDELNVLSYHTALINQYGITAEPFGNDQLVVTTTPVCLKNQSIDDIVRQVASWLLEERTLSREDLHSAVAKKLHAMMACKAAVKAGDALNNEQMQRLLQDLHKTPNRFTCPHGRPTCWLLHHHEIEKKFKRRS